MSPRLLDSVPGTGEGTHRARHLLSYLPVVCGIDAGLQAKHGLISHDLVGEGVLWVHWSARKQAQSDEALWFGLMLGSLDDEVKLPVEGVYRHLLLRSRTNHMSVEVAQSAHTASVLSTGHYNYEGMGEHSGINERKQHNFHTASLLWSSDEHHGWFHLFVLTTLRVPSTDQVVGTPKLVWTGGTAGAEVFLCRAPTKAFVCGLLFAVGAVALLVQLLAEPSG
jgi:hypothetical protein